MFHRILTAVALAGLGMGAAWADGHSGSSDIDTVLAKVGEVEITVGHVLVAFEDLNPQDRQRPPEQLFSLLLEQLVQQEQLAQQLDGISTLTQLQMDNERRSLLATEMVEGLLNGITVTEEDVRALYDRRFGGREDDIEFNASHILVDTEEEAQAIVTALEDGAVFGEEARNKSIGPSGPSGGRLGWFVAGQMLPEFEAAVRAMEVGTTSAPVETQYGWHVIRLNETRIEGVPSYDEVRDELEAEVRKTLITRALNDIIRDTPVELFDASEVDPAKLLMRLNTMPMPVTADE